MAAKKSLADAVFTDDEKLVAKILAKSTAGVDAQDGMGLTALHWAADRGNGQIARLLLDAGASPDAQDMDGLTPLHLACIKGHLECARVMIPMADIALADWKDERTAIEHALVSERIAKAGFAPEREDPARKIADLLASEPGRRTAVEQAAVLDAATGPSLAPIAKARL